MNSTELIFLLILSSLLKAVSPVLQMLRKPSASANYAIKLPGYFNQMVEPASKPSKVACFAFIMYFKYLPL